jgi:hypothetical protein
MDGWEGISMKRFLIVILVLLSNSFELHSTAHKIMVSKVRQQCLQRLEYVMRPSNAPLLELFRVLNMSGASLNRMSTEQPLLRLESPEITVIWNPKRFTQPVRSTSVVADEDLGYDSDDDVQPLFDF